MNILPLSSPDIHHHINKIPALDYAPSQFTLHVICGSRDSGYEDYDALQVCVLLSALTRFPKLAGSMILQTDGDAVPYYMASQP
jgi:hypothetical protein